MASPPESKWPPVSSPYHRGTFCGPCYICGKRQERYDHYDGLSREVQEFLMAHSSLQIPGSSCICRNHRREALRQRLNSGYVPALKKTEESSTQTDTRVCMYKECASTSETGKLITPSDETLQSFRKMLDTTEHSVLLCEKHYQLVYRKMHERTPCAGCGAKPKVRQDAYTRHSPDPFTISQYLSGQTEFPMSLQPTDIICRSCYDLHMIILRSLENQVGTPMANLQSDIELWKTTLAGGNIDEVTRALLKTVLVVAKLLQHEKALLLPQAAAVFREHYSPDNDDDDVYLEVRDGTVKFSARWLMNQLITHLQPYMGYRCVVDRLGTLIYSRNADIMKTLSLALYHSPVITGDVPAYDQCEQPRNRHNKIALLNEAADVINDIILEEIQKHRQCTVDLTTFNLEDHIKDMNPLLWQFVTSCTRSFRERTNRPHGHGDDAHVKKLRNYFIICMLMFATNACSATSLHHFIADTVEVCGGSRQLLKVLNRLGVSVSADTHDRLVTYVAEKHLTSSIWTDLSCDTFTVATVDNIDFLQSHAAVYCNDRSRSTTIQVVQPVPSLKLQQNTCMSDTSQTALADVSNRTTCKRLASSLPEHGPKRRRTLNLSNAKPFNTTRQSITTPMHERPSLQLEKFQLLDSEVESKMQLSVQVFSYLVQKHTLSNSEELGRVLKHFRAFCLPTPAQLAYQSPSTVYYMDLLDENADSDDTMAEVAEMIIDEITAGGVQKHVLLIGDGKTYDHLCKVKQLYGSTLSNVLLFPGDWHILKNFQPVLLKAYYHAGLQEIAKSSGYRAETLKSLANCSHFMRTHLFLVQAWEALYLEMVSSFLKAYPNFAELEAKLVSLTDQQMSAIDLMIATKHLVTQTSTFEQFNAFVATNSAKDDTWKLWYNFVFQDCYCYVTLFLSIRTSNWNLRVSSLKSMAPLFAAYDRPCYQRLLPRHIADLQTYPQEVIDGLSAGGFTVKLTGVVGHAVALDECHEMCINRDLKMAVARPSTAYLKKTTHYFSYRIKAQKNISSQLFPLPQLPVNHTIWDETSSAKRQEDNVSRMRTLIAERLFFPASIDTNRGVVNLFTNKQATNEQAHDMLNARQIGEQSYLNFVTHTLLQMPSVNAPVRRKQLLTMAPCKITRRRMTQQQQEQKETNRYLRKRLAWCNQTGQKFDESEEQYSLLPRSLADTHGLPHKGNKSKWTDKLKGRYKSDTTPFLSCLEWTPDIAIIDSMFIINTNPLRQHKTLEQYSDFLFRQHAVPRYSLGISEVHFVFDTPTRMDFNPKFFEQKRRDTNSAKEHSHLIFTPQSSIPKPWREFLNCRTCKRSIIEALGLAFCRRAPEHLRIGQKLILSGCLAGDLQDQGWEVTHGDKYPKVTVEYASNAVEADMRIWRHALQTNAKKVMIYSPDTDIYNIGLTLLKPGCHYIVQLNLPQYPPKYVSVNKLIASFKADPDLATVQPSKLPSIMQQLYVCTGCDYLSYFSGIGKAMFLNCFMQYAQFITGKEAHGDLSQTQSTDIKTGFLSFIRLIGTVYFKQHLATVVSRLGFDTPNQLYNSLGSIDEQEKHKLWYMKIRGVLPILFEEQRPPTLSALWRHWMRSCWIKQMWGNCSKVNLFSELPLPESQGWLKSNADTAEWQIDWEAEDVIQRIKKTLDFLTKGCSCKSGCKTRWCSCRKGERQCGAGCECRGCTNFSQSQQPDGDGDEDDIENEDEEREGEQDTEPEETDEEWNEEREEDIETEIVTDTLFDLSTYLQLS